MVGACESDAVTINTRPSRTQTLAEAQTDRVERPEEVSERGTSLGSDVPDSCAVEVHHDAVAVSVVGDTDDLVLGEYGAVERVLELDDGGRAAGRGVGTTVYHGKHVSTLTCGCPDREKCALVRLPV